MQRSSFDLCCSERGEDLLDTTPWHLRSPSTAWRQAHRQSTAHQTASLISASQCKEQIAIMLGRERQQPQLQDYAAYSNACTTELRRVLVLSISCAGSKLGLRFETTALAVNLLDRFIATQDHMVSHTALLSLATVACISLAVKLEEVHVPNDLSGLQVAMPWLGLHKPEDIKQAEWRVATALDWRCLAVTPASFLDELLCDAWHGPLLLLQQDLGHCFADVRAYAISYLSSTVPAPINLHFMASTQAAAAILTAFQAVGLHKHLQQTLLRHWAILSIAQVEECAQDGQAYIHALSIQRSTPVHGHSTRLHVPCPPVNCPSNAPRRYVGCMSCEEADSLNLESASSLASDSTAL